MRLLRNIAAIFLLSLWFLSRPAVCAAASFPLALSHPLATSYPVASGVPFARGEVVSLENLVVRDGAGNEVPAQFEKLAQWPDGSYKSVLVILIANPQVSYRVEYGAGVTRQAYDTGLSVSETKGAVTVTTGAIRVQMEKSRFAVFDQVWNDINGDKIYDGTEEMLAAPGDLFLLNAQDKAEYKSSLFKNPEYTVEEKGPIRVVVRVSGKLQGPGGKTLTDFIVRMHFFANKDYVKFEYTLVDTREEKDVMAERKKSALELTGYGIRFPLRLKEAACNFGGENGAVYSAAASTSPYLYQYGRMNYRDGSLGPFSFGYSGAGTGAKAAGWMNVETPTAGIGAFVRNFWQEFPKELSLEKNQLHVYLHPTRASAPDRPDKADPERDLAEKRYGRPGVFYSPREGMAKTSQVLFRFGLGKNSALTPQALNDAFQAEPRFLAPVSRYMATGVFGELLEAGPWSRGYDQYLIDGIYTRSVANVKENGGLAVLYGWRDFGDRMRPGWNGEWKGIKIPSFYNDTHVGAHNFMIQYLRTFDPRWWELGENATRHWMDIDVSHSNRWGRYKRDGKPVTFGPGEGHMVSHDIPDHHCRALHLGHAHLSGLPDYYLLTGDKRALEVIREVGDWFVNAVPVFFGTPVGKPHQAEAERDYAWPLFVLLEAYRATGDTKYLLSSAQIVKHLIEWWQQPTDHFVNGAKVGRNDWKQGTGWWHMYPGQDNAPRARDRVLYNGTNPWMAGALISSVIQFYEYNKDYNYTVDNDLVLEMLFQTMNYVVKYGYNETKKSKDYAYFIYSEAQPHNDGGSTHIMPPLAYLTRLYQQGRAPHPGWYDTAPRWWTIVQSYYDGWKDVRPRGDTDTGFYGYEMIYPADFWAIMRSIERTPPPSK